MHCLQASCTASSQSSKCKDDTNKHEVCSGTCEGAIAGGNHHCNHDTLGSARTGASATSGVGYCTASGAVQCKRFWEGSACVRAGVKLSRLLQPGSYNVSAS